MQKNASSQKSVTGNTSSTSGQSTDHLRDHIIKRSVNRSPVEPQHQVVSQQTTCGTEKSNGQSTDHPVRPYHQVVSQQTTCGIASLGGQSTDHQRDCIIKRSVNRPPFTPYQNVNNHTIMTGSIFRFASGSWPRSFCNRKDGIVIPVTFHQSSCPRTAN